MYVRPTLWLQGGWWLAMRSFAFQDVTNAQPVACPFDLEWRGRAFLQQRFTCEIHDEVAQSLHPQPWYVDFDSRISHYTIQMF
jgi:hypothetical protein